MITMYDKPIKRSAPQNFDMHSYKKARASQTGQKEKHQNYKNLPPKQSKSSIKPLSIELE